MSSQNTLEACLAIPKLCENRFHCVHVSLILQSCPAGYITDGTTAYCKNKSKEEPFDTWHTIQEIKRCPACEGSDTLIDAIAKAAKGTTVEPAKAQQCLEDWLEKTPQLQWVKVFEDGCYDELQSSVANDDDMDRFEGKGIKINPDEFKRKTGI